MSTTRITPPDTLDRRQVLLLWYWPRARGPHIHLGYGLPRVRVLTAALGTLATVPLLALLLLAGDQGVAAALAALLALPLALLSSGRRARGWYLLDPHGRPTRYLSGTKPLLLAGQPGYTRRGFHARLAQE
jgi:hypothetical protein